MVLLRSTAFIKAARKYLSKHPRSADDFGEALRMLAADPHDPRLKIHKLKGELQSPYACSAGYDCRIVFSMVQPEGAAAILLETLGTHDEVYQAQGCCDSAQNLPALLWFPTDNCVLSTEFFFLRSPSTPNETTPSCRKYCDVPSAARRLSARSSRTRLPQLLLISPQRSPRSLEKCRSRRTAKCNRRLSFAVTAGGRHARKPTEINPTH